jgi:hypothetical protein
VRLQAPTPTKLTDEPLTVQTEGDVEVALNTVPLPLVAKVRTKLPPFLTDVGIFVIDTVGVAGPTLKL